MTESVQNWKSGFMNNFIFNITRNGLDYTLGYQLLYH